MALKLHTTYPGRFDSPSENYPQGKWRNRSNSLAHDGGYLEEKHMNDIYGFFGALLRNAEMSPNGEVDTAKKSQFYDALVTVAKSVVGEEGYRKLDDNVFNGYLRVRSEHEGQGTGVFLQDIDGTVRGQVVATDQGLHLTQYPKDGGLQTFTFPNEGEGGEIAMLSEVENKIDKSDAVGSGKVMRQGAGGWFSNTEWLSIEENDTYNYDYNHLIKDLSWSGSQIYRYEGSSTRNHRYGSQLFLKTVDTFVNISFSHQASRPVITQGELETNEGGHPRIAHKYVLLADTDIVQHLSSDTNFVPSVDLLKRVNDSSIQLGQEQVHFGEVRDNAGDALVTALQSVPKNCVVTGSTGHGTDQRLGVFYRPILRGV